MSSEIALVIPPSPFLADERVFPFLGVLKVASSLEREGVGVDVLDLSGISNYQDVVGSYLSRENPKVIGITATTPQFPHAVGVANKIREVTDARVILGGAHATMVGSAFTRDKRYGVEYRGTQAYRQMVDLFDVSVIGDGERAIFEAVKTNEKVVDASDRKSEFFLQKGELEDYPFPNRELIDMESYHYEIDGRDAQSMIAQLGCPFECGFCGGRNTPSFRIARTRNVESIIDEVDVLVGKYNKRGVMFYDDELNVNKASLVGLMEGLIHYQESKGVDLRFRGFVKAELFDEEQAKIMKRAGFNILLTGVESGDDRILDTMRKHTTRETNRRLIRIAHDQGLKVKALMSIGHAGETRDSVQNSIDWVLDNRPDDVDWTIITQYPGSPYFDESVPDGDKWVYTAKHTGAVLYSRDINYAEQSEYYKGVPGDYTSYVWTDELSPSELVAQRDRAERITRGELGLGNVSVVRGVEFEKSMGMGRVIPGNILRSSQT